MKIHFKYPSTWIVIGIIFILVLLYIFGFRITYAPELENSWDAVSACAAWAGVIASAAAVFAAIWIPKRIADRQDKIALFEKRFAFYEVLSNCISFAATMEELKEQKDRIQEVFIISFSTEYPNAECPDFKNINLQFEKTKYIKQASHILRQGRFLFDFGADDFAWLEVYLVLLLNTEYTDKEFENRYFNFVNTAGKIERKWLTKIVYETKLTK